MYTIVIILSSSVVEQSAVNRFAVGSNPTWGEKNYLAGYLISFLRLQNCLVALIQKNVWPLFAVLLTTCLCIFPVLTCVHLTTHFQIFLLKFPI